ncbi:hypothetical protein TWF281_008987 [Arthrobotrys megalospora]
MKWQMMLPSYLPTAVVWFCALTGISAKIVGYTDNTLLFQLYKSNPENVWSMSQNFTSLVNWVTKTRPLGLTGRINPEGYEGMTLTDAINIVYTKVNQLVTDLKDPALWTKEEKLVAYGFDQQTVMALTQTAPEFFEDRALIAENYLDDIQGILSWDVKTFPDFYSTRVKSAEIMNVWEVIYDMVVFIIEVKPNGVQLSNPAHLLSYILWFKKVVTPPDQMARFAFAPEDTLKYEYGVDSIALTLDTFLSGRDWNSIDLSYKRLTTEFDTSAPFWKELHEDHEYLRKFIHDYMMLFWNLRKRLYVLRGDMNTWAATAKIEWVDTGKAP